MLSKRLKLMTVKDLYGFELHRLSDCKQRDAKYNCFKYFKVFLNILYRNLKFIFTELLKKMVETHSFV